MPYTISKEKDKWRVVDGDGRIAKNAAGTAMDGGGHASRSAARAQARAVMAAEYRRKHGE